MEPAHRLPSVLKTDKLAVSYCSKLVIAVNYCLFQCFSSNFNTTAELWTKTPFHFARNPASKQLKVTKEAGAVAARVAAGMSRPGSVPGSTTACAWAVV